MSFFNAGVDAFKDRRQPKGGKTDSEVQIVDMVNTDPLRVERLAIKAPLLG